jgi:acetolactate synthase-1/2/3 large subunit
MADTSLTGADALVGTLADCGVTVCFANPGTSEMNLVTALDKEPRIRSVLCLFEGVTTGAADGFARISGEPAMTLLHLGAGYLNAGANIHNARRAHTPMINVIGDHATYHSQYDAPLTSDIRGLVTPNSVWVDSVSSVDRAGELASEAWAASLEGKGGPVSLILPADSAWDEGGVRAAPRARPEKASPDASEIEKIANAIRSAEKPLILLNGTALLSEGLEAASRLEAFGARTMTDTFVWRQTRGGGHFAPAKMQYFAEAAMADLQGHDLMVLVGTQTPAAFFAYPGKPSLLVPEGCEVVSLGGPEIDSAAALSALADVLDATTKAPVLARNAPDKPTGPVSPSTVGASINRHMPAGSLVSDDGVTASLPIFLSTLEAESHEWMNLTGGAIGQGLPLAVGASMAKPTAKTIALTGDGAGMYTIQSLWTMARENLDVTTIVFVNHSYRILNIELQRTGAGNPGPAAQNMLNLGTPEIDWVKIAEAQGVPAEAVSTADAFDDAFERAMNKTGPKLIAVLLG